MNVIAKRWRSIISTSSFRSPDARRPTCSSGQHPTSALTAETILLPNDKPRIGAMAKD
ncbi:MAG: hypothetical protein ABIR38_02180 [Chthoniobacterales bacterium]